VGLGVAVAVATVVWTGWGGGLAWVGWGGAAAAVAWRGRGGGSDLGEMGWRQVALKR
jgi:hypothetical protein